MKINTITTWCHGYHRRAKKHLCSPRDMTFKLFLLYDMDGPQKEKHSQCLGLLMFDAYMGLPMVKIMWQINAFACSASKALPT